MFPGSNNARLASAAVALALALPRVALADQTLTFDGDVPKDGPEHFFIPFTVPAGTAEIQVHHDDLSDANILDWGLSDQNGGYRGWGGGTTEDAVVGVSAASRAYVPGGIAAGTWNVIAGKAKVVELPAKYHVTVTLRAAPTLAPQGNRAPYVPHAALATGRRYYAGDLHVHSLESTDARPSLDEIATFARARGLDFVEVSDHNTITQLDFFGDAQSRHPDLLLVPGIEYTTYHGHANAIGATKWVDHKIGQPGVTIQEAARQIVAQGAIFSVNHALLDVGNQCIGCSWHQPLGMDFVGGVEIGTGGLQQASLLFQEPTIAFWESFVAAGYHVVPVGGSDDHQAGKATGALASPIGDPTTMVLADELSAAAIVDGIKKGHVVVRLQGPSDPMVAFSAGDAVAGDKVTAAGAHLTATITGGVGYKARFVHDGQASDDVAIDTDPFTLQKDAVAPATGEERWRVEILDTNGSRHVVTNHIWLALPPPTPLPIPAPAPSSSAPPGAGPSATGGCSTARQPSGVLVAILALPILALVRRRRR